MSDNRTGRMSACPAIRHRSEKLSRAVSKKSCFCFGTVFAYRKVS